MEQINDGQRLQNFRKAVAEVRWAYDRHDPCEPYDVDTLLVRIIEALEKL